MNVGDKVKNIDGFPFSSGKLIEEVVSIDHHKDTSERDRIWLTTGTWSSRKNLKVVSCVSYDRKIV